MENEQARKFKTAFELKKKMAIVHLDVDERKITREDETSIVQTIFIEEIINVRDALHEIFLLLKGKL